MSRRRTAVAVASMFFVNGAVFGNWAPRIPAVASDLALEPATLGLALAGVGTGGLLATPLAAVATLATAVNARL